MAQVWRIGLFKSDDNRLITVYTDKNGEPVRYEQPKVGGRPLLHTGVYTDMKYSEARAKLLLEAKELGIEGETGRRKAPPRAKRVQVGEGEAAALVIDDSEVPIIEGTPYSAGWRSKVKYVGHSHKDGAESISVFISPDGDSYVLAANNERADLLVDTKSMGRVRLRLYETSGAMKRADKQKAKADAAVENGKKRKKGIKASKQASANA